MVTSFSLFRILTTILLILLLSICIDGKSRRDKPSRWKEAVKETLTIEKLEEELDCSVEFTYSLEHDVSCDCLRSVPTNVTHHHRRWTEHEHQAGHGMPFVSPGNHGSINKRYLTIYDNYKTYVPYGMSIVKDNAFYPLGELTLDEYFISFRIQSNGVFMLISFGNKPICDDHFNDLTATALCQRFGYKGGRRAFLTVADRMNSFSAVESSMGWDPLGQQLGTDIVRCFRKLKPEYVYDEGRKEQVLNVTVVDKCRDDVLVEALPCSRNQAAAVSCFSDIAPRLQFYNFQLSRGVNKFYLTFEIRFLKFGRLYSFFEDDLKMLDVMPKRSDFSAVMCDRKVPLDFQSTNEMGKGRHHVILGKFLKKCEECVQIMFRDTPLFERDVKICKPVSRDKWLQQRNREIEKELEEENERKAERQLKKELKGKGSQ